MLKIISELVGDGDKQTDNVAEIKVSGFLSMAYTQGRAPKPCPTIQSIGKRKEYRDSMYNYSRTFAQMFS